MDKPHTPAPGAPRAPASEPRYDPDGGISRGAMAAAAVLIALAIGGGWYWWQQRKPAVPPVPTAVTEPAPVAAAPAPPPPAASEPAIQHPIEAPPVATAEAPRTLDQSDAVIAQALSALLGSKPGASMVRRDDFVRRAVATIDNLGRAHAAPRLWPVNPMAGKFSVEQAGGKEVISQANSVRYSAFVAFAESLDSARAAALYKQNYPLFQTAYKELGYPSGYFNDRVVAVIDQLLATPEPAGPLAVKLTEVKGEVASTQPWTRYEFADPQLEALPAGSKALLRMGPDNARKLKAKLRELRGAIAKGPAKN
jgi:Protein of unknown function (DUF3014)